MPAKRVSLVVTSLLIGCAALPAQAATPNQVSRPVREWMTENKNDDKGAFSYCSIKNIYDNDVLLMVAENAEGAQRLVLNFPQDKMQVGQKFDLTLQVDKSDVFPTEAVATTPRILSMGIPSALPDEMRKGTQLYVRGPKDEVVYTLQGINGGITALRDCVATSKNGNYQKSETQIAETPSKPSTMSNAAPEAKGGKWWSPLTWFKSGDKKPAPAAVPTPPVASQDPGTLMMPAAPKPAVAMQTETVSAPISAPQATNLPAYWTSVFMSADLAPNVLINTDLPQPLDYTWQKNRFSIGIKENLDGKSLEHDAVAYLRSLKMACGSSSFVAETAAEQEDKDHKRHWVLAETACSNDRKRDTIAALIFAEIGNKTSMVVIEGPAGEGAAIIKSRNAVLGAMR